MNTLVLFSRPSVVLAGPESILASDNITLILGIADSTLSWHQETDNVNLLLPMRVQLLFGSRNWLKGSHMTQTRQSEAMKEFCCNFWRVLFHWSWHIGWNISLVMPGANLRSLRESWSEKGQKQRKQSQEMKRNFWWHHFFQHWGLVLTRRSTYNI